MDESSACGHIKACFVLRTTLLWDIVLDDLGKPIFLLGELMVYDFVCIVKIVACQATRFGLHKDHKLYLACRILSR